MSQPLDLKALERKAFRSTFQDGLWDLYFGCLLLVNTFMFTFLENEQMPWLIPTLAFVLLAGSAALFWLGKKYITAPRLGHVKFGPERRKKGLTLGLILAGRSGRPAGGRSCAAPCASGRIERRARDTSLRSCIKLILNFCRTSSDKN